MKTNQYYPHILSYEFTLKAYWCKISAITYFL